MLDAVYKALERWDEMERQARTLRQITKADVRRNDRLPDGSRIPTPRRSALARYVTDAALTAIREYDEHFDDGPEFGSFVGDAT